MFIVYMVNFLGFIVFLFVGAFIISIPFSLIITIYFLIKDKIENRKEQKND